MLHPAIAYLMGRKGEFLDLVRLKDDPDQIVESVETLLKADR